MAYPLGQTLKVIGDASFITAAGSWGAVAWNSGPSSYTFTPSSPLFGTITIQWNGTRWRATAANGTHRWDAPLGVPASTEAPVASFTALDGDGNFAVADFPGEPQIDWAKSFTSFAGNPAASALAASITIPTALLYRRIYAHIGPSGTSKAIWAFTLSFIKAGQIVGALSQRIHNGITPGYTNLDNYWAFAAGRWHDNSGGDGMWWHSVPHSLLFQSDNNSTLGYPVEIPPIEMTLACDTVQLQCTEYYKGFGAGNFDGTQPVNVVLACLSSAHRF